ncbi:MAG: 3-methyl-2-oxobutanoate hydroxymethyltransferase [Fimbriimonadales bacterium]
MSEVMTAPKISSMKGGRIVCVTAYDTPSAQMADEAGVDLILVGDSVGNTTLGYENTLPVTLDEMIHHVSAAARGCKRALLVADMPFGSFQASAEDAIRSGIELVKAGAAAVKLEGPYMGAIGGLVAAGVPVMGHIGMTPQSVHSFGGFRVQGRGNKADVVLEAGKKIADAGVFSVVLEMIPAVVARRITDELPIPTIGIGAGPDCDGEVQVWHDILGLSAGEAFKHTKRFLEGRAVITDALRAYAADVRRKTFPGSENSF